MKHSYLLAIACTILSSSASSQFRKYSNEFLNIGVGARGLAMGGAQVASVNDGTSGYWNPAGLVGVQEHATVNLMHAEYSSGIGKFDYAALTLPSKGNSRTLGITALRFAVDDIPYTLFLVDPDGTVNYNNIKSFSSSDYAVLFSFAQKIRQKSKNNMQLGINAKVIHRSVGDFAKAWGFGLDAGLQFQTKKWKFGFVGKDISTTFNSWSFNFSDEEKERLYLTDNDIPVRSTEMTAPRLVAGAGRQFVLGKKTSLLAEANLDFTFDGQRNSVISSKSVNVDPRLGLELNINDAVYLRGGITNFQKVTSDKDTLNQQKVWIYQPSAGAGFKLQNVRIDYSFVNLANQSSALYTHVFSLQVELVNNKKKTTK